MSRLWKLRKSLTAQLSVVSLAFIALAMVQLFVWPVLSNPGWGTRNHTLAHLETALYLQARDDSSDLGAVKSSDAFQKVAALNPKLRFYAETNDSSVSFGGASGRSINTDLPTFLANSYVEIVEPDENGNPGFCRMQSSAVIAIKENNTIGRVRISNCPFGIIYSEITGIEESVFSTSRSVFDYFSVYGFQVWGEYLLLPCGVFFLGLFTTFRSAASVRKIARIAKRIDPGHRENQVRYQGLPLEVYPLVDALNAMLKRLEDARERQRFFLATAAHEMRTPLTILRARLETLPKGEVQTELQIDLRRLSRLVEQLLHLTKVHGQDLTHTANVDLKRVTAEVCADRALIANRESLELDLYTDPERSDETFRGREILVFSAISNLIDNAISVSSPGQRILVSVSGNAKVSVRDFGPGIDPRIRNTLFEPFAKFPPNRDGHGLGLSVVHAIMMLHGGVARVSDPGDAKGGTVFELCFIRDRNEASRSHSSAAR